MNNLEINKDIISVIELSQANNEYYAYVKDKCFKINYPLFLIIRGFKNGNSATEIENQIENYKIENVDITKIYNKLNEFIENLAVVNVKTPSSYVKFRFPLLKKDKTEFISNIFKCLFQPFIFWFLFAIIIAINIVYLYINRTQSTFSHLSYLEIIIMYCISLVTLVFHEIGHASASKFYKLQAKEIGFGFYFIFPVYYTNVTQIWTLPVKQRIIVNLGGIYFQLLMNICFIAISQFSNISTNYNIIFQYIIKTNIFVALYSLFPFFRNDGYWIYCDVFNIKNLISKADQLPRKFIRLLKSGEKLNLSVFTQNYALYIYSFLNWSFKFFVLYKLFNGLFKVSYKLVNKGYNNGNEVISNLQDWFHLSIILIGLYFFLRYLIRLLIKNTVSINEGL